MMSYITNQENSHKKKYFFVHHIAPPFILTCGYFSTDFRESWREGGKRDGGGQERGRERG